MSKLKPGFAPLIIVLIALGLIAVGGGSYFAVKQAQESKEPSQVSPQNDSLLQSPNGTKAEEQDEIPSGFVAKLTLAQARTIAQDQRPGKTIKKIEREVEEGVGVYSVRFTDSGKVDVNAVTGAIMKLEAGDK